MDQTQSVNVSDNMGDVSSSEKHLLTWLAAVNTFHGSVQGRVFHTDCLDPDHRKCKKPDNSFAACQLGGGNCDGYKQSCDCDYRSGGCIISESARPSSACRCKYLGFWTCSGSTVKCPVFTSKRCQYPDRSKASCIFGDGDCGGY